MTRIVSWWSESGGSGKTTNAINSAAAMARDDTDVLLVDLDPQAASATDHAGFGHRQTTTGEPTMMDVFFGDATLRDVIVDAGAFDLAVGHEDLVGFNESLAASDRLGAEQLFVVRDAVIEVADDYDVIVLDTKASMDRLLNNSLVCGRNVMVALELSRKGVTSLAGLRDSIETLNDGLHRTDIELAIMGLVPSRVGTADLFERTREQLVAQNLPVAPFEISDYSVLSDAWDVERDLFAFVEADDVRDLRPYERPLLVTYTLIGRWLAGNYDYDAVIDVWDRLTDMDLEVDADPRAIIESAEEGRLVTDGGQRQSNEKPMPGFNPDGVDEDLERNGTAETAAETGGSDRSTPGGSVDVNPSSDDDIDAVAPDELPHRVRHESPKDARTSVTIYVGDEDKNRIKERESLAQREFDEDTIHTLDVYLAMFRDDGSEASFLAEMRSIGYGFFD